MTFRGNCFVAKSQPGLLQGARREIKNKYFLDAESFEFAGSPMKEVLPFMERGFKKFIHFFIEFICVLYQGGMARIRQDP